MPLQEEFTTKPAQKTGHASARESAVLKASMPFAVPQLPKTGANFRFVHQLSTNDKISSIREFFSLIGNQNQGPADSSSDFGRVPPGGRSLEALASAREITAVQSRLSSQLANAVESAGKHSVLLAHELLDGAAFVDQAEVVRTAARKLPLAYLARAEAQLAQEQFTAACENLGKDARTDPRWGHLTTLNREVRKRKATIPSARPPTPDR